MLSIEKVDLSNRSQVNRFIELAFRIYKGCPYWVPPFYSDMKTMLNPQKHPFYEHSEAEFYLAVRDGQDVGRLAVMKNNSFIHYHALQQAHFGLFECMDDSEAAAALFERAFAWAREHKLDHIVGPRGLSSFDGYGILTDAFDKPAMMTMVPYNYPYYERLVVEQGFKPENDFVSFYLNGESVKIPDEVKYIAKKVAERGQLEVHKFKNKKELVSWASRIAEAYNQSFLENWEYYPLTKREADFMMDSMMTIADPRLIKVVTYKDKVVGFGLAFPDITPAMQRAKGHINPISIADLLLELHRTTWVTTNGGGMVKDFQGRGGNALMYADLEKMLTDFHFKHIDIPQNADTADQMRKDIMRFGAVPYKHHLVYNRPL